MEEKKITWDMHYGLPNPNYLDFVARQLFYAPELDQAPIEKYDPFDLDLPIIKSEMYVERPEVEAEIGLFGTIVIVGKEGSGKTTLFRHFLNNQPLIISNSKTLVVGIQMSCVEIQEDANPLPPRLVAGHIFQGYWDYLWTHPHREKLWLGLRLDQNWMTRFRWFYQRYYPNNPVPSSDFTLMSWLNTTGDIPYNGEAGEVQSLSDLISFITEGPEITRVAGREIVNLFRSLNGIKIELLIDEIEELANPFIPALIQDARRLTMILPQLKLKLFVDAKRRESIEQSFRRRIKIYRLPEWNSSELEKLIKRRVNSRQGDVDSDWGKVNLASFLLPDAQKIFLTTVISNALKAYENNNKMDAPIHALKLSRGLVAACARVWEDLGFVPPYSAEQISHLADLYWNLPGGE